MKIESLTSTTAKDIAPSFKWDLALVGDDLDQRGKEAAKFASDCATMVSRYQYDPINRRHMIDNAEMKPLRILDLLRSKQRILIEATTLGVSEIALLLRWYKGIGRSTIDILYIEPKEYRRPATSRILGSRDFTLTDERHFLGVPGFTLDFQQHPSGLFISFLGYEGQRLATALNQLPLEAEWRRVAVFGVPGFGAGWELNALANNVEQIHQNEFHGVKFCAASSVLDSYTLLEELFSTHQNVDAPIAVAPFGTKPHSIATALFLCKHSEFNRTALVFDHPKRSSNRTSDVWRWHHYAVTM